MQAAPAPASNLWRAASAGDAPQLDALLREAAGAEAAAAATGTTQLRDLLAQRVNGHTALMTAVQNGRVDAVRRLCECDELDLRASTDGGRNAIHLAAEAGHRDLVELLAELQPEQPEQAGGGGGPEAAPEVAEAAPEVQQLAEEPAKSEEEEEESTAEEDDLTRALSVLPEPRRSSMRATLETMQPAACAVVLQKLLDAAPRLEAAAAATAAAPAPAIAPAAAAEPAAAPEPAADRGGGGLLASVDSVGNNCLHLAAFHGRLEVLRFLLTKGQPHPCATNADGLTALHFAAEGGRVDALSLLLALEQTTGGAPHVDAPSSSGMTALHKAVQGGHTAVALALLRSGAGAGGAGAGTAGFNAYHYACAPTQSPPHLDSQADLRVACGCSALSGQHATLTALFDHGQDLLSHRDSSRSDADGPAAISPPMTVDLPCADGRTPVSKNDEFCI